jgi:hypothetical protein
MSTPYSGGPREPPSGGGPDRATDRYPRDEYLTDDYADENYAAHYSKRTDGPAVEDVADYDAEYVDYHGEWADSRRWRWVAGVAAAVLVSAVIATVVILNGGDTNSTVATVVPSASRPAFTPPPPTTRPSGALPPETVTTLTPSASPRTAAPAPETSTPATNPPPETAPNPRTIVYSVSGTRLPGDLVSVTYTDEQGAFRTDLNVTLPWSRTVILNPNVEINSVTAISFASQLNCTITDALGSTVASQSYNTIAATCNR